MQHIHLSRPFLSASAADGYLVMVNPRRARQSDRFSPGIVPDVPRGSFDGRVVAFHSPENSCIGSVGTSHAYEQATSLTLGL